MISEYVLGLDKLELTLRDASNNNNDTQNHNSLLFRIKGNSFNKVYKQDNFTLIHINGNIPSMYNIAYTVYYHTKEIGSLYLDGRINSDYINFKITNEFLKEVDLYKTVNDLLNTFEVEINNISALDVFIDCRHNLIDIFNSYFFNTEDYHFINRNKTVLQDEESNVFSYSSLKRNGIENKSYYIGNKKKTGKQVCIYNKTKELEISNKQYYKDLHNQHLPGQSDVYRFELKLINKYLRCKGYEVDFNQLNSSDYLKDLFGRNLNRFVDFRNKDNAQVFRCSKVHLFDLSKTNDSVSVLKNNNNDTQNHNSLSEQRLDKQVVKRLIDDAIKSNNRNDLKLAENKAKEYNLIEYFNERTKDIKLSNQPHKTYKSLGIDLF